MSASIDKGYEAANVAVGVLARKIRERAGLSQADMAKRLGVSQPVVSLLEGGRQQWTVAYLEAFGDLCGLQGWELLKRATDGTEASDLADARFMFTMYRQLADALAIHEVEHYRADRDGRREEARAARRRMLRAFRAVPFPIQFGKVMEAAKRVVGLGVADDED